MLLISTTGKRLADCGAEVEYLLGALREIEPQLGSILFQLPPFQRCDVPRLAAFAALLPDGCRAAFEFRHPSWFDDEVFACLRGHNAALCMAETEETQSSNLIATATWGYLRLRRPDYSRADLSTWKERILAQSWDHAYIFFKHEDEGIGPKLAAEFRQVA